jgi:hypothetical protein
MAGDLRDSTDLWSRADGYVVHTMAPAAGRRIVTSGPTEMWAQPRSDAPANGAERRSAMDEETEVMVDDLEADVAGEEDVVEARYDLSYVGHACHTGGICQ